MAPIRDRCPTCGFDPATVSPNDVVVAARSFPRRYRAVLVRPDDEDGADVVRRRPPGGRSALEHAAVAAEEMRLAAAAVRTAGVADEPTVALDAGDPAALASVDVVLDGLMAAAEDLAAAVDRYPGDEWHRPARLAPDGSRVSALDVARAGVHAGMHHLRDAARAVEQVRGRP